MFSPNSAHTHIQLSYASATSSLNDRTRFPNFWRTYPSNDNLAQSIVAVVMHYGWMQLKIITQDESLFTSVSICLQSVYRMYIEVCNNKIPTFNQTTQLIEHNLRNAGIFLDMSGTILFQSEENVATKDLLFVSCVVSERMYVTACSPSVCFNVDGTINLQVTSLTREMVWP